MACGILTIRRDRFNVAYGIDFMMHALSPPQTTWWHERSTYWEERGSDNGWMEFLESSLFCIIKSDYHALSMGSTTVGRITGIRDITDVGDINVASVVHDEKKLKIETCLAFQT